MAAMRRFYLTLIILVALLSLGITTSCIVRSHPSRGGRAYPVRKGHHKHAKKQKKHKHLQDEGEYDSRDSATDLD
jgi:hypothetical protein